MRPRAFAQGATHVDYLLKGAYDQDHSDTNRKYALRPTHNVRRGLLSVVTLLFRLRLPLALQRVDERRVLRFVSRDSRRLMHDVAQLVDALHQTMLRKTVHRKFHHAAIGRGESLFHKIYLHSRIRIGRYIGEQRRMYIRGNHNRQQ